MFLGINLQINQEQVRSSTNVPVLAVQWVMMPTQDKKQLIFHQALKACAMHQRTLFLEKYGKSLLNAEEDNVRLIISPCKISSSPLHCM